MIAIRCSAQLSWRLPPRSSRWRWCLPELASSGATPAWRASWASEGKRSIGPISQSSFAALKGPQPGSCEQPRRDRVRARVQLPVELADRAGQRSAAADEVARDPCLGGLLAPRELSCEPVEPDRRGRARPAARAASGRARAGASAAAAALGAARQRRSSRWSTSSFSSRSVAYQRGARRAPAPAAPPARLRARRRSDLPRIRPRRRCGVVKRGGTRTSARPAEQLRSRPRMKCQQSSPPQRLLAKRAPQAGTSPPSEPLAPRSSRPSSSTATAVNECFCTSAQPRSFRSPPLTIRGDRRADRPHSRQKPGSYQVTLDGLGKAAATQRWQISPRATFGNRVSRRQPESLARTGRHHRRSR